MTSSYDSMNEQTQKLEVALKYTHGDMDRAKLMVSGKLQDVVVVKGKFISPEQKLSGAFLGFVNVEEEYISAIRSLTSQGDSLFSKLRVFDEWKSIYKSLLAYGKDSGGNLSGDLNEAILREFIEGDVFPDVKDKNLDYLSNAMHDFIKNYTEDSKAKCQIELEETNSMEVDFIGIDIMNPESDSPEVVSGETGSEKPVDAQQSEFQSIIDEIEAKAQAIVEGNSVLSPVKGKFVNEISNGEKIYVNLSGKDSVSQKILDAYKARDHEGKPMPILGRVVEIVPNEGQGVVIYVLVAKGIYAKIIEEENVKLQTESSQVNKGGGVKPASSKERQGLGVAAYLVFVVVILGLIVILTFF